MPALQSNQVLVENDLEPRFPINLRDDQQLYVITEEDITCHVNSRINIRACNTAGNKESERERNQHSSRYRRARKELETSSVL